MSTTTTYTRTHTFTFTFSAGKAVLLLAAIALFVVFRTAARVGPLDSQGQQVLSTWLAAEYTRAALPRAEPAVVDSSLAARLVSAHAVTFQSLKARGTGDDVVVRAEITVAGKTPPVGEAVRYFRMRHSLVTGWTYNRETTAFAYYTHLF